MRLILSKPPRTYSEELWEELGCRTLAKRHSIVRMMLVCKCVMGRTQTSLCKRIRMNNHGTRVNNKLLLKTPKTDFFKKSLSFYCHQLPTSREEGMFISLLTSYLEGGAEFGTPETVPRRWPVQGIHQLCCYLGICPTNLCKGGLEGVEGWSSSISQ